MLHPLKQNMVHAHADRFLLDESILYKYFVLLCQSDTVNKGSWIQAFRLKTFFIYGEIQNEIVTFPIS